MSLDPFEQINKKADQNTGQTNNQPALTSDEKENPLYQTKQVEEPSVQPPYSNEPPQPPYGQAGQQPPYSNAPPQPPYGQAGQQPPYSNAPPQQTPYGQAGQQPSYSNVPPQQTPYGQAGQQPPYSNAPPQHTPYGQAGQQPPYSNVPPQQPPYGQMGSNPQGNPYQPPYGVQPPPSFYNANLKGRRRATASLILGLASLALIFLPIISSFVVFAPIAAIIGIVLGALAIKDLPVGTKGRAVAGIIVSAVGLVIFAVIIVIAIIAAASYNFSLQDFEYLF